tara:strand:- start:2749 stop:3510 length:762 start_codon:yes stop_codon:yes gene_type:complete
MSSSISATIAPATKRQKTNKIVHVNVSDFANNDINNHFVVNDATFCPIRELRLRGPTTITDFVTCTILKHPNCDLLLRNLSDIYVLVAHRSSNGVLRTNEQTWEALLPETNAVDMENNGHIVIGWMLMDKPVTDGVWPIWFVDTLVPSLGLASHMMNRIEDLSDSRYVVPGEIIPSARVYWVRWFLNHSVVERWYTDDVPVDTTGTTTLGELFDAEDTVIHWRHWTVTVEEWETSSIVLDDGVERYRLDLRCT